MMKQVKARKQRNRGDERGLTLVEALIAMLVSVVGLVSLAGIFTVAMKMNASSRNLTTATTFAQDKLEELGTVAFERLVDPSKMVENPQAQSPNDVYVVGSIEENFDKDGVYYYDKIILAVRGDIEPEGTVTIVRPDGTAETRRPDGTVIASNPFPQDRITYSRRWLLMSSNEENPADRRLTVAVRVKSEMTAQGKEPELVDLYTVFTQQ